MQVPKEKSTIFIKRALGKNHQIAKKALAWFDLKKLDQAKNPKE